MILVKLIQHAYCARHDVKARWNFVFYKTLHNTHVVKMFNHLLSVGISHRPLRERAVCSCARRSAKDLRHRRTLCSLQWRTILQRFL